MDRSQAATKGGAAMPNDCTYRTETDYSANQGPTWWWGELPNHIPPKIFSACMLLSGELRDLIFFVRSDQI
jgi:hypothetical protein